MQSATRPPNCLFTCHRFACTPTHAFLTPCLCLQKFQKIKDEWDKDAMGGDPANGWQKEDCDRFGIRYDPKTATYSQLKTAIHKCDKGEEFSSTESQHSILNDLG